MLLSLSPNSPSHEAPLSLFYFAPFVSHFSSLSFISLVSILPIFSSHYFLAGIWTHHCSCENARAEKKRLNLSKIAGKKICVSCLTFFFLLQYIIVVWQDQRGASVAYIKTRPRHLSIMIWKRRGLRQNAGNHNIAAICRSCAIQSAAGFNRSLNWHIAHEEGSAAPPSLSCYGHTHMQRPHTHVYSKSNCTHTSIKTIYVEWPRGELKLIAVICPLTTFSIGEWHSD